MMVRAEDIFKEAVVAWLIMGFKSPRRPRIIIETRPVAVDWEGETGKEADFPTMDGLKVLGIVPAQPGTFLVRCCPDEIDGFCIMLGYELPGAYHPDWVEECKERIKKGG